MDSAPAGLPDPAFGALFRLPARLAIGSSRLDVPESRQ
jgi:hypothetical protein